MIFRFFLQEADNLLRFPVSPAVLSVAENQPADTEVGQLKLAGQHRRNLAVTVYPVKVRRLLAAEPVYIAGNNITRISVRTLEPLDHETMPKIKFRLVVFNPDTAETVTVHVTLFVKNLNDNPPAFKQKIYSLTAPLSTRRFESVGSVSAVDPDGDKIIYRSARKDGPFVVVPQTGEILLAELPDQRMYLLQLVATDNRPPVLSSKPALVYISFEDNDVSTANLTDLAHSRVKRRVTRAVRPTKRNDFTEADGEPEGKIVFQLEKESERETFKIRDENPWVTVEPNGAVRVKKKWDYEELGREKTIDFWVIITNAGSGGRNILISFA